MRNIFTGSIAKASLVVAAPALALSAPTAQAAVFSANPVHATTTQSGVVAADHGKDRGRHEGWRNGRGHDRDGYRYRDRDYRYGSRYGEPVRRDTRVWRGNDGRYYCRKDNGTTGLLIGGAVGGLLGHEIAGDKTLGAIVGVAGGALLGRAIDKGDSRCR